MYSQKEAARAAMIIKKREQEHQELKARKRKIEEDMRIGNISNKFAVHTDFNEIKLKSDTIGLVSLDEMKAKEKDIIEQRKKKLAEKAEDILHIAKCKAIEANNLAKKREKQKETLSFSFNDEEDEENEEGFNFNIKSKEIENEEPMTKKRFGKNPEVDTSFLPDRDREEQDAKDREVLRVEWEEHQSRIKNEQISITYSYWDGSGHRRDVTMNKGNTISQFLQRCLSTLKKEFNELKIVNPDQLMYIKEDLIIAHHYSFYDFIVTKARGKSGPLFNFDVHGDIRISSDASIEKDESHAGKICLRSWYDRNKHIFPASRWEPYNPEKEWTKYTVSDKEAAKIVVK